MDWNKWLSTGDSSFVWIVTAVRYGAGAESVPVVYILRDYPYLPFFWWYDQTQSDYNRLRVFGNTVRYRHRECPSNWVVKQHSPIKLPSTRKNKFSQFWYSIDLKIGKYIDRYLSVCLCVCVSVRWTRYLTNAWVESAPNFACACILPRTRSLLILG